MVPFSQTINQTKQASWCLSIDHVREIEQQRNEQIVSNAWEEKERIRFNQCNVLFTRIEQVFITTATTATPGIPSDIVSVNSEEEIEREEIKARLAVKAMDTLDRIKEQRYYPTTHPRIGSVIKRTSTKLRSCH
jgi:hypothetical protein